MSTCSICLDSFTGTVRKRVDCSYCDAPICRQCLQAYLLNDTAEEPRCASCRAAWSHEFLNEHFTAAFRNGSFKAHREKVLLDRERARLPETQQRAVDYKNACALILEREERGKELSDRMCALPTYANYWATIQAYGAAIPNTKSRPAYEKWAADPNTRRLLVAKDKAADDHFRERAPLWDQYNALRDATYNRAHILRDNYGLYPEYYQYPMGRPADAPVAAPVAARATHKCPKADCMGFLDAAWTCGLCRTSICGDCEVIKTGAEHTCDATQVASVKAIRREAKACPTCTALISKIDGCDQMWCTQCQTAFSWNTGAIETHVIHNPHYFQWMRANGGMPRAPGDGAPACAWFRIAERLATLRADTLMYYLQRFQHMRGVDMERYRTIIRDNEEPEWRNVLRVRRMLGEFDDDKWKFTLQKKEKETHKARARLQLLEMFTTAGMDILGQIMTDADVAAIERQIAALSEFTKAASEKICKIYKCVSVDISLTMPAAALAPPVM